MYRLWWVAVRVFRAARCSAADWLAIIYSGDDTSGMYSDKEAVRGLIAQRDIPRWQPILPAAISDQPAPTSQPTIVPVKMVKIVVATQNLPSGYTFPKTDLSYVVCYA